MEEDNQYGALPAEQGVCTELYYYNHKNNSEQLVLQLVRHEQVSSRAKREDREGDTRCRYISPPLPLHRGSIRCVLYLCRPPVEMDQTLPPITYNGMRARSGPHTAYHFC